MPDADITRAEAVAKGCGCLIVCAVMLGVTIGLIVVGFRLVT